MMSSLASKPIPIKLSTYHSPANGMKGRNSVSFLKITSKSPLLYPAMCVYALWSIEQLYSLEDIFGEQTQSKATPPTLSRDLTMKEVMVFQKMAH